jgi:hypothetical protein
MGSFADRVVRLLASVIICGVVIAVGPQRMLSRKQLPRRSWAKKFRRLATER